MEKRRTIKLVACFIAAVAAIVIAVALFAGCGSVSDRLKVVPEKKYFDNATELTEIAGCTITGIQGDAAIVTKGAEYGLYNFAENRFVIPLSSNNVTNVGERVFRKANSDGASYDYYSVKEKITTLKIDESPVVEKISSEIVLFRTANTYYYIKNDGSFKAVSNGLRSIATSVDYVTDKYLLNVTLSSSGSPSYIEVYDVDSYELVRRIDLAGYVYGGSVDMVAETVLGDGNVMFQYFNRLPENATTEDYDLSDGRYKYVLRTYKVNVKNGKVSEKDVDYAIVGIGSKNASFEFGESFADYFSADNVAAILRIKDKEIMNCASWVALNNDLGVDCDFGELYGNGYMSYRIADDIYFSSNGNPNTASLGGVLTNGRGDLIANDVLYGLGDRVFHKNGKAYDFSLKVVATGDILGVYGKYVYYRSDNKYYVNGKEISSYDNRLASAGLYVTVSRDTYSLMSVNSSSVLATSESDFGYMPCGDYVVVSAMKDGSIINYKITPAA